MLPFCQRPGLNLSTLSFDRRGFKLEIAYYSRRRRGYFLEHRKQNMWCPCKVYSSGIIVSGHHISMNVSRVTSCALRVMMRLIWRASQDILNGTCNWFLALNHRSNHNKQETQCKALVAYRYLPLYLQPVPEQGVGGGGGGVIPRPVTYQTRSISWSVQKYCFPSTHPLPPLHSGLVQAGCSRYLLNTLCYKPPLPVQKAYENIS